MEKRVFLAILLSLIVMVAYQTWLAPPAPPPPAPVASGAAPAPGASPVLPGAAQPATSALQKPAADVQALIADTAARDIVVETADAHAVFSSAGGVMTSLRLKHFKDGRGEPLELVPSDLPPMVTIPPVESQRQIPVVKPFTLGTDDAAASARLTTALFRPSVDHLDLGTGSGTLTFEYQDASGLHARKTFRFQPDGKPYVIAVDASVDINGASHPVVLSFGPALGLGYNPDGSREAQPSAPLQYRNGSIERLGVKGPASFDDNFRFAGVNDHYFLSAVIADLKTKPNDLPHVRMEYQPITLPVPVSDVANTAKKLNRTFVAYNVATQGPASLQFFVGPKDFNVLQSIDPELTRAIDYGMFRVIVVPLLQALKWIHTYVGNYGWSIIVLTVLMNILIFPLRHKSMVSMKKMQALQPEIKAINDRYAKYKITDPERQKANQETMALYKAKGVSPASGCLPMLLTFPILFAFYALLGSSIELRGAPFIFWIHDLSLRDPYFITPIIMGGTMFWQQRMMPAATADPIQAKVFMFMPLIFTYTFLWAPAGLAIYWFSSNLLAIGQQFITNRMIAAPSPAVAIARPKTTIKKIGGNGAAGKL